MNKFSSIVPAVLTIAALLLGVVIAGCDNGDSPPAAPATAHTPPTPGQVLPAASSALEAKQGAFTITGNLPGMKDGTPVQLSVLDPNGGNEELFKDVVATKVEHGRFILTGTADQPLPGSLRFGDPHGATIHAVMIVEPGAFTVVRISGDWLAVKGGNYNNKVYGYYWQPSYVALVQEQSALCNRAFTGLDMMDEKAAIAASPACLLASQRAFEFTNDYQSRILDGDASPLLKLLVLWGNQDRRRYGSAKRTAMLDEYARTLGATHPVIAPLRVMASEQRQIANLRKDVDAGKPYKDIMAVNQGGTPVKLSAVLAKNKLVLLDFWASWCVPCRAGFPFLRKDYKEFHKQGFEIYAVSVDEDRGEWLKALREEGEIDPGKAPLPWINLNDPGISAGSAKAYGVQGLPSNRLISSDGTIVGVDLRERDLEKALQAQFKRQEGSHGG